MPSLARSVPKALKVPSVGIAITRQKKAKIGLSSLFHCPKSLPLSSFKCPTVDNNMSNNWKNLMPVGFQTYKVFFDPIIFIANYKGRLRLFPKLW